MLRKFNFLTIALLIVCITTLTAFSQVDVTTYEFTDATTDPLLIMGPGFDSMPRAQHSFDVLPVDNAFPDATDGNGLVVSAAPGRGLLILAPIHTFDGPSMIRCSVRSTNSNVVVVLGAIDTTTNNFVTTQTANDGNVFLNQYQRMTTFNVPPTGTFQPVIQVMNHSETETVKFYIDRLQVYSLLDGVFYNSAFLDGDETDPAEISSVPQDCPTPIPTPTLAPTQSNTPTPTPSPTTTPNPGAPTLSQILGEWNLDVEDPNDGTTETFQVDFQPNGLAIFTLPGEQDGIEGSYTYDEATGNIQFSWSISTFFGSSFMGFEGTLIDQYSMSGIGASSGGFLGGGTATLEFNFTARIVGAPEPTPTPPPTPNPNIPPLSEILGTWNVVLDQPTDSELDQFALTLNSDGEAILDIDPFQQGDEIPGSYSYEESSGELQASWIISIPIPGAPSSSILLEGQLEDSQTMHGTFAAGGGIFGGSDSQMSTTFTATQGTGSDPSTGGILGLWNLSIEDPSSTESMIVTVAFTSNDETTLNLDPSDPDAVIPGTYNYDESTGVLEASWVISAPFPGFPSSSFGIEAQVEDGQTTMQGTFVASGGFFGSGSEMISVDFTGQKVSSFPDPTPTPVEFPSASTLEGAWSLVPDKDLKGFNDMSYELDSKFTAKLYINGNQDEPIVGGYSYDKQTGKISCTWAVIQNGKFQYSVNIEGTVIHGGRIEGIGDITDFSSSLFDPIITEYNFVSIKFLDIPIPTIEPTPIIPIQEPTPFF